MENKLAKALYDNTAECPDELAFRKGDIVMVLDESMSGTSGWWLCSLYGRQGLAPSNRLQLLQQTVTTMESLSHGTEQLKSDCHRTCPQSIYQTPGTSRLSNSPSYELMEKLYNVPSTPLSASKSPISSALKYSTDTPEGIKPSAFSVLSGSKEDVYDVPNQTRQASHYSSSTTPRKLDGNSSLMSISALERSFDAVENLVCSIPNDIYMNAVPSSLSQESNYDIPVPAATEAQQRMACSHTLPNPRKTEWIYDVPLSPEKPGHVPGGCDRKPSTVPCRSPYDALPACPWQVKACSPMQSLYDIPKPSSSALQIYDSPSSLQRPPVEPIYDKPLTMRISEEQVYAVPPQEHVYSQGLGDFHRDHIPLECRVTCGAYEHNSRECVQRSRKALATVPLSVCSLLGNADSLLLEDNKHSDAHVCPAESQRISTESSSSASSFDSLGSSAHEPLREVTLSQEEACRRLLELKEAVCNAVPRLMVFVSSCWRSREHLEKHLQEIRQAADEIAGSVVCFLSFALDVKGNASRLTDTNLQSRLYKQLSIVEDSGVILRQTAAALNMADWPLTLLCQDPGHAQPPDQLERFVMVARTVPEDVKRLVSILNANGKLLFRSAQTESEPNSNTSQPEAQKSPVASEQTGILLDDDNDYVQLQTKTDFEKQQEKEKETKDKIAPASNVIQQVQKQRMQKQNSSESHKSSLSEHCRLYFGALQKAIGAFVCSLQDGQPPEKFISQSKLVIMVGQRLVDTLYREAQRQTEATQSLLCKSNHLCAMLKQLAVATKKAALHFPDKQALSEAQDYAKELTQRAQHFRVSLDL